MKRSILLCVSVLALVTGCGEETFEAPPDCTGRFLVAYARMPAPDQGDLYLFDHDGLGFHLLPGINSTSQQELNPTLSRNVRFIAFERVLTVSDHDILVYDRCQASLVNPPNLNTTGIERDPAFSGDGNKLAFVRDTLSRREIRLYDGVTDRLVPLPGIEGSGSYLDSSPVINQNATLIVFSRFQADDDVLVYDAVNDSLIDLPDLASAGSDVDPSITPDGRYLVFASDRSSPGDYDLYLYDLQLRSFLTLPAAANTAMTERHPSVNYNTDRIVFESNRTGTQGSMDIYLLTRSSGNVTSSGSSPTTDAQPWIAWQ
ncbi:MAG TPA: hypothetical protein VFQ05_06140 [Candidatus Eisenbacteria bacterium]|nr:hypothetical protein [Candidatus Eisenbacteria bacterium]